jgi:hypothetical protein
VVHQRIRNSGIKDVGESIIMGQGMVFNKKEKSQDIRLGQKLRREGTGMTGDRSHPVRTSLLEKRPPKGGQEVNEELLYSSDKEDRGGNKPSMDNKDSPHTTIGLKMAGVSAYFMSKDCTRSVQGVLKLHAE